MSQDKKPQDQGERIHPSEAAARGYKSSQLDIYRRFFPELVAENRELWNKIGQADQLAERINSSLISGRLAAITVDAELVAKTQGRIQAYNQARAGLNSSPDHPEDWSELRVTTRDLDDQLAALKNISAAVRAENELLKIAAEAAAELRADPLGMMVWYEAARGLGPDKLP